MSPKEIRKNIKVGYYIKMNLTRNVYEILTVINNKVTYHPIKNNTIGIVDLKTTVFIKNLIKYGCTIMSPKKYRLLEKLNKI